jgi:hypothetical protein
LEKYAMQKPKGMIQVEGTTYRISRVRSGLYEVARILDNEVVGWFSSNLDTILANRAGELATLRTIARQAVQDAKTSWAPRDEAVAKPEAQPARTRATTPGVGSP